MTGRAAPQSRFTARGARLLACLALVAAVAAVGGAVTGPQIPTWYSGLAKPAWTPPDRLFPIAWTVLYALMAVSLWRLWDRAGPSAERARAVRLFLAQLALNALWSPVFFGLHWLWGALAVLALLVAVLAATLRAAVRVDPVAGLLLVPYLAWLCYAFSLNAAVAVLN